MDANDPVFVKIIENGVLLNQALRELQEIKTKQDLNHAVAIALAEHKTIEKTDTLWDTMRQLNGSLSVIRVVLLAIAGVIPVLIATHQIWGWPA